MKLSTDDTDGENSIPPQGCKMCQPKMALLILENKQLKGVVSSLMEQLSFLRKHPKLVRGLKGETLVAEIIDAHKTNHNASFDLTAIDRTTNQTLRIEVKYSSLAPCDRGRSTNRWTWTKPFGESEKKLYDRLVLVGEADKRFMNAYRNRFSPFVLFDIPYEHVRRYSIKTGKNLSVQLTTNPNTANRSIASALYRNFQLTEKELFSKYGL